MKCHECSNMRINHALKLAKCAIDGKIILGCKQSCHNRKSKTAACSLSDYQLNWLIKQV